MCVYESLHRPSVISIVNTAHKKQQEEHRQMLLKQLRDLCFLMRQGLPYRSHDKEEGNLYQLMKMQAEDCPRLLVWPQIVDINLQKCLMN